MSHAHVQAPGVRRRRRVIAIAAVIAVVVVLAVLFYLAANPAGLANAVKGRVLPKVSEALGRPVNVERVSVRFFPRPEAVLEGVSVGGATGEPDLAEVKRVEVQPKLWRLVASRGRDVEVSRVVLSAPTLTLVRHPDGSWNYQSIQRHLAERPPAPKREVVVSEADVRDGTVDVVEQSNAGTRTLTVGQIDVTLTGVGPGLPFTAKVAAALASEAQNVHLDAKVDPLPAKFANLTPAELPKVTGTLQLSPLDLPALEAFLSPKAAKLLSGGEVSLNGRLGNASPGLYRVDADGEVKSLLVRGAPASGRFQLVASVDPLQPSRTTADVTSLQLTGPGLDVSGHATASLQPLRVRYALSGPQLNLDSILALRGAPSPGAAKTPHRSTVLASADVQGTLQFQRVVAKRLELTNFAAETKLDDGVLRVSRARADAYGGAVALDGTTVDLTSPSPAWHLVANVSALDLGTAMQSFTSASPLVGRLTTRLDLAGDGEDWAHVRQTATGQGGLQLHGAALTTMDLSQQLAPAVTEALKTLGKPAAANALQAMPKGTPLENLGGSFAVKDGWLAFTKPFSFKTPLGAVDLSGRVGLDERLDFTGAVRLDAARAKALTNGLWSSNEPLPIPVKLGGTLASPTVSLSDPQALAKTLALGAVSSKLGLDRNSLQKQLENEAARQLRGLGL